jgi:hypothetical protein
MLLKNNAERRGLPMMLPLMDMTDLNQVTMEDMTTLSMSSLQKASQRYTSDALLVTHIIQDNSGFSLQWKLVVGNDGWGGTVRGQNLPSVIATFMDSIANALAGRFAVVTTNTIQKNISIKVTGITQQEDFVQLVRYLNHLPSVADVSIAQISGNEVLLNVSLRSTLQAFLQSVSIGPKLTLVGTDTTLSPLVFEWKP